MFIWYVLLILTIFASLGVAVVLLPTMFLKTRHILTAPTDRGLKKIVEKNGQSMVFEPALKWRKYIRQYVLAERQGKKELMCKLASDVSYIYYDIVIFNNRNEVCEVLRVKDLIERSGYTKIVELPQETSYVSLVVNEVDGVTFPDSTVKKVKAGKIAKFLAACSLVVFMEILFVKVCFANIFGGIFRESFVLNGRSFLVTLLIAATLIVVNLTASAIALKIRNSKKSEWSK